jgi:hypothetical protein
MAITANNTTLTFNDATTQTTSGVTSVGVSTGLSSTGGKTPTLTNTGVTSVSAGTGISVSASTGGVTITNTGPTTTPQLQQQVFFSSGSWTAPTGVTRVAATCIGGGGGGNGNWEVPGGEGGYALGFFTVSPGTTYTVTIGAGGAGQPFQGSSGGTSSFGSFVSATGGGGGNNGGSPGSNGTGTVSSGTAIRSNRSAGYFGTYPFEGNNKNDPTSGGATAMSATTQYAAGSGGGGRSGPLAFSGGMGGVIFLEWAGG